MCILLQPPLHIGRVHLYVISSAFCDELSIRAILFLLAPDLHSSSGFCSEFLEGSLFSAISSLSCAMT